MSFILRIKRSYERTPKNTLQQGTHLQNNDEDRMLWASPVSKPFKFLLF